MIGLVVPIEGPDGAAGSGTVVRPALLKRLGEARVATVCAPPGSGKTVLLRSWASQPGIAERAAFVAAGWDERDPQRFWLSLVDALRRTGPGARLVREVSAAPDLDGWAVVERLLTDLAALDDWLWLVIDDVHELSPEALRQLELLIMRAPSGLRFVLATRHDVHLGLHRLRLEGELAEIRAAELRFSLGEAGELFAAAGVELPAAAVAMLYERTEGWAAGLRLAALAVAGHLDPERFAAEFSGSERTVAEYLMAEVLDRQDEPVRRLLLRTSILDRVNGELANVLTGDEGGEGTLQDLERAGAFVVSLDPSRTWFRYHPMFADFLRLELRRTAPEEVAGLHRAAAEWFAGHELPTEAIWQAQEARDWVPAARMLADYWPGLRIDGQGAAIHELLTRFPAGMNGSDPELAVVTAADELPRGSLEEANRYLDLAERAAETVPETRQGHFQLLRVIVGLLVARQSGNLPAVAADANQLQAMAETIDTVQPGLREDLRAFALICLGDTELWMAASEDANRAGLERAIALARQAGRPYLEFTGLARLAVAELYRSFARASDRAGEALELARRHGWTEHPAFGVACLALATVLTRQGRPEEAETWIQRAERTVPGQTYPAAVMGIRYVRATLELERHRDAEALAALQAAEPLAARLVCPHYIVPRIQALTVCALVRLDQADRAAQVLARLSEEAREHGEIRIATAVLRLAQGDPGDALAALAPLLDAPVPVNWGSWLAQAYVLEAIARDALDDPAATGIALERALDLVELDGALMPFLLHPAPELLQRHAGRRTVHAALITEIRGALAGATPTPPSAGLRLSLEPLSDSEIRVLRYLPTNLSAPEIASELFISRNTVKTHMRNLYAKLGTHTRTETVGRARTLGLLAPSRHDGERSDLFA